MEADFLLTYDYSPWLIEINSTPSMEANTKVTPKLYTKVLEKKWLIEMYVYHNEQYVFFCVTWILISIMLVTL